MRTPGISTWKSDKARHRFLEMEDELWADRWPQPPEALDVPTFAGPTRVYRWRGDGTPVVFLHGMGGTALAWTEYVAALPGRDRYAIDTMGDVGRSEQTALLQDAADLARWLDETLAGAGIERAHLVGTSYGGYLSLNLAARAPARVASLTLIDTGGLAPIRLARFMLWGVPSLVGSLAPAPIRRRMAKTRPLLDDVRLMKMALHGQMNHPMKLPAADPLSAEELRSIAIPTTVLVAGRSAPFDPTIQAERAALIPEVQVEVVHDAQHDLSWTHVDRCIQAVPVTSA